MVPAQRNQYLQTLGVVQYVPRDVPLVSILAQPAPETSGSITLANEINVNTTSKASSVPIAGTAESLEAKTKSMAELSNIGLEGPSKALGVNVGDIALETSEPSNIAVKFALWQPTDDVLVCSSVEDSLPDPEQILLLGNILLAMGQGNGPLPQMDIVQWPPYPNVSGDSVEVRDFLATLIRARISSKSVKTLLLMGDTANDWLLTVTEKAALANGQVSVFDQVTALVVPSLKEMIEQPLSKRKTWQTIRFLSPQRHVHKAPP